MSSSQLWQGFLCSNKVVVIFAAKHHLEPALVWPHAFSSWTSFGSSLPSNMSMSSFIFRGIVQCQYAPSELPYCSTDLIVCHFSTF